MMQGPGKTWAVAEPCSAFAMYHILGGPAQRVSVQTPSASWKQRCHRPCLPRADFQFTELSLAFGNHVLTDSDASGLWGVSVMVGGDTRWGRGAYLMVAKKQRA